MPESTAVTVLVTPSSVYDAEGKLIERGSIVGMSSRESYWHPFQGLVIEPNSTVADDGYCVAVFFDREVGGSRFNHRSARDEIPRVEDWDREHYEQLRFGDEWWLFNERIWMKCPRIIYFRPSELTVAPEWDYEQLANRAFHNTYHALYKARLVEPFRPGTHMCWCKDCQTPARRMALCNGSGAVSNIYVCEACYIKWHGKLMDDLPPLKDDLPNMRIDVPGTHDIV